MIKIKSPARLKIKKLVLTTFLCYLVQLGYSQCVGICGSNLISNPGFELTTTYCDSIGSEIFTDYSQVQDWYGTACVTCPGNGSTPDYYNSSCANAAPTQNCGLGTGSVGFFTSVDVGGSLGTNAREYVQTPLTSTLIAGQEYCVTIEVRTSNSSFAFVPTDGLGLWFTDHMIDIDVDNGGQQFLGPGSIVNATPQISNPTGNIIGYTCTTITGTFIATGTETWLVIGNFLPDNLIQTNTSCGGFFSFCYGYLIIDQADVFPICTTCDATINPAGPFCETDPAVNLTAAQPGGTWSGIGITNGTTGTFDPSVAGPGIYTITYNLGCGSSDTETITVNAVDDATFNYASTSYCVSDPNPTPTISGTPGGTFTISAPGVINSSSGQINISGSGSGTFTITYTTPGTCSASSTATITITTGADATITPAGPFCSNDPTVNLVAVDAGGTWSGTGITDAVNGTFDPAVAGAGTFTITYTISGGCGDTDTETITVNADADASFLYSAGLYCTTDPDPTPTVSGTPGGTFTISTPGVINATTGQINIASSGTGTFTITYNTGGFCAATATQTITISSGANATISPSGPFCANDAAVNLVAVDPGGTWSGTGITNSSTGTFDPATAGPGTHTITYTISGSCGATDTETITVNAVGNASFSYTGSPFCVSGADPIATITGTPGGTFTITTPGVINASNGTIDLSSSGGGTFTVTYNTGGVCPASSTASVTIISTANTTITAASPFCEDDPSITLLAATPGGTWSGPGITNAATGQFDPGVAGAGTHIITYTISGSCGGSSTTTIVVNPFESATISYAVSSFCSSDADPFPTIIGNIGGTFTIDNGGVINSTTGILDISASGTGAFTVTYTTGGLCFDVSTFNITISPSLTASVVNAGPFCLGDAVVTLNGSPGGGTWSGDGITDTSLGIFNPDTAGAGAHEIIYSLAGTCGDDDTIEILVSEPPSAWVSNDTTIFIGDEAQLFAGGGTSYFWYEDQDISCTDCQNPEVDPLNTTTYCAIVYNSYGCADTACATVTVDQNCGDVFIPNAFSPNDNGENNMECVYGRCIASMTFTIYDRWGEKVFVTESQDVCWDGIYKGKPMNTGVYVYIFEATLLTGEVVEKKGNITLIR